MQFFCIRIKNIQQDQPPPASEAAENKDVVDDGGDTREFSFGPVSGGGFDSFSSEEDSEQKSYNYFDSKELGHLFNGVAHDFRRCFVLSRKKLMCRILEGALEGRLIMEEGVAGFPPMWS